MRSPCEATQSNPKRVLRLEAAGLSHPLLLDAWRWNADLTTTRFLVVETGGTCGHFAAARAHELFCLATYLGMSIYIYTYVCVYMRVYIYIPVGVC